MNFIDVESVDITGDKKSEEEAELRKKVDNLFKTAKKFVVKEDVVKVVKTVIAGVRHIVFLGVQFGLCIIGLVMEYIKEFIGWCKKHLSKKDAAVVSGELAVAV